VIAAGNLIESLHGEMPTPAVLGHLAVLATLGAERGGLVGVGLDRRHRGIAALVPRLSL